MVTFGGGGISEMQKVGYQKERAVGLYGPPYQTPPLFHAQRGLADEIGISLW